MASAPTHTKPCPQCGKAVVEAFRPFCSARCCEADLGAWFAGKYAIPAAPLEYDLAANENSPPADDADEE